MSSGGITADLLPKARPAELTVRSLDMECWRIDEQTPDSWTWEPFLVPRHRFDSFNESARVRYAGKTMRGAARQRWNPDRTISSADGESWLVHLNGTLQVVDLRDEKVLDALGLDDRINTARDPDTWQTCQKLGDRLRDWFGTDLDAIVYRSRTTPETSANIAWHNPNALDVARAAQLRTEGSLLDNLVLNDRFTVRFSW